MTKEVNRCAFVGCHAAPLVGQTLCGEHRLKPLTTREAIAEGPKFDEEIPDRDGARCVCGDGANQRDRATGLCRVCWRIWRWSPIRERGRG